MAQDAKRQTTRAEVKPSACAFNYTCKKLQEIMSSYQQKKGSMMITNAFQTPSIAREFFLKITKATDPLAELTGLVGAKPPTFETEWLDFKAGQKIDDHAIKKTWSEALAGFGNTQ